MNPYSLPEEEEVAEELPWLVFKLHNLAYTINSHIVTSIVQIPDTITPVASAPEEFRGVLNFRGDILPILDLRKFFGVVSRDSEVESYVEAFAEAKVIHSAWLADLERHLTSGERFTQAFTQKSCKFGAWAEAKQKSSSLSGSASALTELLSHHSVFHQAAERFFRTVTNTKESNYGQLLDSVAYTALKNSANTFFDELDSTAEEFKETVNEMVVVVNDDQHSLGFVVDEVVAVDELDILSAEKKFPTFQKTKFFNGVAHSAKIHGDILLVNEDILLASLDSYDSSKK
ncbi:MAG: chemotaxis protein CheW [Oscillospiraceae bacterium]|jgi:purine-binding chemotaxis protein CheW|nr:chemotaxis protein CheW [Oscillospiraceae bacterium]